MLPQKNQYSVSRQKNGMRSFRGPVCESLPRAIRVSRVLSWHCPSACGGWFHGARSPLCNTQARGWFQPRSHLDKGAPFSGLPLQLTPPGTVRAAYKTLQHYGRLLANLGAKWWRGGHAIPATHFGDYMVHSTPWEEWNCRNRLLLGRVPCFDRGGRALDSSLRARPCSRGANKHHPPRGWLAFQERMDFSSQADAPSQEFIMDRRVQCQNCKGAGCATRQHGSGWLSILSRPEAGP